MSEEEKKEQKVYSYSAGGLSFNAPLTPDMLLNKALFGAQESYGARVFAEARQRTGSVHLAQTEAQMEARKLRDPFMLEPAAQAVFMLLARELEHLRGIVDGLNDSIEKLGGERVELEHPYPTAGPPPEPEIEPEPEPAAPKPMSEHEPQPADRWEKVMTAIKRSPKLEEEQLIEALREEDSAIPKSDEDVTTDADEEIEDYFQNSFDKILRSFGEAYGVKVPEPNPEPEYDEAAVDLDEAMSKAQVDIDESYDLSVVASDVEAEQNSSSEERLMEPLTDELEVDREEMRAQLSAPSDEADVDAEEIEERRKSIAFTIESAQKVIFGAHKILNYFASDEEVLDIAEEELLKGKGDKKKAERKQDLPSAEDVASTED